MKKSLGHQAESQSKEKLRLKDVVFQLREAKGKIKSLKKRNIEFKKQKIARLNEQKGDEAGR